MVSSGRPAPPYFLVTSWPSMVPTVRLMLRMGSWARTGWGASSPTVLRASAASLISWLSSALARPWSWAVVRWRAAPAGRSGTWSRGARSRPWAFQWLTARPVSRSSAWPTASSRVRKPSSARISRTSSAMNSKKLTTNSALPLKRSRRTGFWVAMPTGQVSRWQTRIMTQPETTRGAVAKPNSSAPRRAATTTSRPVFSWPSVCTTMRSRSPLSSSVCWVSARPSSQGPPACLSEVSGEAPVPPSWPEMRTTSAWALETPAATVPTPTSDTSFTWMRAAGLAFLRSWMSWARSSME